MKKTAILNLLLIALTVVLFLPSCDKNEEKLPTEPVNIELTLKQTSMVSSVNEFAFDIFRLIAYNPESTGNIIISPLSISQALSMTANGAAGATRDSIMKALREADLDVDDLNTASRDLVKALLNVDSRISVSVANSVWAEKRFQVKKAFVDILTSFYSAEKGSFDVNDPNAHVPINSWIENKTNGLIKNMLDKVADNARLYLINAIYFKGEWKYRFDASATTQRPFYKAEGVSVNVPTMSQKEKHKVYRGNGFIFAEFPYGQGNFVMDVFLPEGSSIESSSPYFTAENFSEWIENMNPTEVNLRMPRFKYGFKATLNDYLKEMGMGIAFDGPADFTNIADEDLIINRVLHQGFIENNEKGTEAAAATIVEVGYTSVNPDQPLNIDLNRPFIYIIREVTTNTVLFMGTVNDPLAE